MKKTNVTFSIPESLNSRLHASVEKRSLSLFVSEAIEKALKEEEENLKRAYTEANKDEDRMTLIEDWKSLDGEDWGG
jgi:hypothetical protein